MELVTSNTVFLGIVVQPKTKRPIYIVREAQQARTVQIVEADPSGKYAILGEGYLDRPGSDYAFTAEISGYPRAHTPEGVTERGGGYGTCLYTGLILLACAEFRGLLNVPSLAGSGEGISSETSGRSSSADAWWAAAGWRRLTEQVGRSGGEETETLSDQDLDNYLSSRSRQKIREMISEAVSDYEGWWPTSITIRADLERTTEAERTVDVYTFESAVQAGLVALVDVVEGSPTKWAAREEFDGEAFKDVLLALNVSGESLEVVAKLAQIAATLGATRQEIDDMTLRNRFAATLPEDAEPAAEEPQLPPRSAAPPTSMQVERLSVRARVPEPSRGERQRVAQALGRLEERRARLPWDAIEDLP